MLPRSADKPALRMDWIEHVSYAGEFETCMYSGAKKGANGAMTGWRDFPTLHDAVAGGSLSYKTGCEASKP